MDYCNPLLSQFISEKNLIDVTYNLNQELYPLYDDGTEYYADEERVIYRITLEHVYLAAGTGNDEDDILVF